ncbi:MAG: TIGR04540 family protein [Desulfobacterales bacterium]|nr:TIGR04540 family protein [Desulfobacterales bacterium]
MDKILKNPSTVKSLANQIVKACDLYLSRKISENSLKEYLVHFARKHGDKLFNGSNLNPTVLNRIGKKRTHLVNIMLEDFQATLF